MFTMNSVTSLLVAIFAVSLLWSPSSATPCSDVCKGTCSIARKAITILHPLLEPFADSTLAACQGTCDSTCACNDGCSNQCGSELMACRQGSSNTTVSPLTPYNPYRELYCLSKYSSCYMMCGFTCATATAAGVLGIITNNLLSITQSTIPSF